MKEIFDIILDNNLLIGGVLSPLLYKFLKSKRIRKIIGKFFNDVYNNLTSKDYKSHHYYANILFYKTLANNIEFECKRKTRLFRLMSVGDIEITERVLTKWIEKYNSGLNSMSKVELRGELLNILEEVEETIEKEIPESYFKALENRDYATVAFEVVYDGKDNLVGYRQYKSSTNKLLVQFITDIPDYESLSGYDILNMFMSQLDVNTRANIQDIKNTFKNLNGRLCK